MRKVKITWYVETGNCDGGGVGYWDQTKESIPFDTEEAAHALADVWIKEGKLVRTRYGGLEPKFDYGMFRIRRGEEVLEVTEVYDA